MKTYLYAGIAVALLILGGLAVVADVHWGNSRYQAGVEFGTNQVLANDARAAKQYQDGQAALTAYTATAGQKLNQTLGTALPAIQEVTHGTVETIRTIYVQSPASPGSCGRPNGVQQALDTAVDRANAAVTAAASGVRHDAPAVAGTARTPAGDGGGHARE